MTSLALRRRCSSASIWLRIAHHAGFWLRDGYGNVTKRIKHVCWDGCMFPNEVMMKPQTWNSILSAMVAVREAHGWRD